MIEGPQGYQDELPLTRAGLNVVWTDDLSSYRERKVRVLNGLHTSMISLGLPWGFRPCARRWSIPFWVNI